MEQLKIDELVKLYEENKELKMVLRKLSHEMGNALTLLGASIFYLETEITNVNSKCDISDLKNDYTYICNLFRELREYNHTEAIVKKEVEIGKIINVIENSYSRMPGSDNISLLIHRQDNIDKKKVYIDKTKMYQVFINILKNSIDALNDKIMEKNIDKRIDVTVKSAPILHGAVLEINNLKVTEILNIEIRDNGKGIDDKIINKIFQPMFTFGKENGTGLGLSIVKKIIEDHNGKIEAVSVLGTGTAINIYIPILN